MDQAWHLLRTEVVISREEALRRTQLEARDLLALRRGRPDEPKVTEIVEVLADREGYGQRWTQVQTATHTLAIRRDNVVPGRGHLPREVLSGYAVDDTTIRFNVRPMA